MSRIHSTTVLLAVGLVAAVIAALSYLTGPGQGYRAGNYGGSGMGPMMGQGHMMMGSETVAFDEDRPFDLQFIDRMIPHHQMAIVSSEHMISDSERPELRELARNIQESQSEQIEQMRAWRGDWYGDPGPSYPSPGGREGGGMMGGDAADAMFLRMMILHHQQAIDMSEQALERAEHPEIRRLAEQIIAEQTAEIELMRGYLREIES
jgi:uncharacterized protein (DUF305 family)